jgi:hypothetical protein
LPRPPSVAPPTPHAACLTPHISDSPPPED